MDPHFEMLAEKSAHTIIDHQHRTVSRIKYSEVKYSAKEVVVPAKNVRPFLKAAGPFFLVLMEGILAFEDKLQLIVSVIFVAEDAHQVDIELVKMPEVSISVLLNFSCHVIHHAQWIRPQEVLHLNKVDEVLQERGFE
jgi:hypothetical protein